jgi:pseudouridine-5'-phosphate glycosidase
MGVPVISYQSDDFPDFFTRSSGQKAVFRCDTPQECASIIKMQVAMGLETGMLFAVPIPEDKAGDSELIRQSIDKAISEANEKGVKGADITPFLLKRVSELSEGNSSDASKFFYDFNKTI